MAWDLAIGLDSGDITGGYVTGQDEILQRVRTRVYRMLGEWFVNTDAGLPWYRGYSTIIDGELTRDTGILGSKNASYINILVRNEIAETDGVLQIIDYNGYLDTITREYTIIAKITTAYGAAYLRISQPA